MDQVMGTKQKYNSHKMHMVATSDLEPNDSLFSEGTKGSSTRILKILNQSKVG